jgi:muconolactone D-isomerase
LLYCVEMNVAVPLDFDPAVLADLKAREKAYSQELQRSGKWRHIWRLVGQYANVSIFDVDSNEELHDILSALPLGRFMTIVVRPLAPHPSALAADA